MWRGAGSGGRLFVAAPTSQVRPAKILTTITSRKYTATAGNVSPKMFSTCTTTHKQAEKGRKKCPGNGTNPIETSRDQQQQQQQPPAQASRKK